MGRYNKLGRQTSQSSWTIQGVRCGTSSVEEEICPHVRELFNASECRFHAEGREDIDVRMLGTGRNFVLEVRNPKTDKPSSSDAETLINSRGSDMVKVQGLSRSDVVAWSGLQSDAEEHQKTYVCVCWSEKPLTREALQSITARKNILLQQKTPLRVLHRRTPAIRPRLVHWLEPQWLNEHYFSLRLMTQAGTYVKEFVHGDFGRTTPSLREMLGCPIEIVQLDVLTVG